MIRLRLLGGLSIESTSGELAPAAVQRRRLALLALVITTGSRGITRDRVLALLWPENDAESARHSLNQSIYVLRRSFGGDPFIGTAELRINESLISSDLGDLLRALESGALEEALDLYKGPFLDGVHVGGSTEFEQWLESERARLQGAIIEALRALVRKAEQSVDADAALRWWRRLVAIDPLDGRYALGLISALAAAGDRAGALVHGRVYETLLKQELGVAPDKSLLNRLSEIRQQLAEKSCEPRGTPQPSRSADPSRIDAPTRPRRRFFVRGLATAVVLAVVVIATITNHHFASAERISSDRLVVLPFTVSGDRQLDYLRDAMVDLLSAALDGASGLRAVDPRTLLTYLGRRLPDDMPDVAKHFGAGRFVTGSVVAVGGNLRVSAAMYDVRRPDEPLFQASAQGTPNEIFNIVDGLTRQLLARRADSGHDRLGSVAAKTTNSLPALKAYYEGESAFRAGRYDSAMSAFRTATTEDSAFALAYYRYSVAADWSSAPNDLPRVAADQATRYADRLSEHDRLLLEGLRAWRAGDSEKAESLYRQVLARYPDDAECWYQLGESLFHGNPLLGKSPADARAPFERVLWYDPRNREAMIHLARIAALVHDRRAVDTLIGHAIELSPNREDIGLSAFRAFTIQDSASIRDALARLAETDYGAVFDAAWRVAVYAENYDGAARILRLLTTEHRLPNERAFGYVLLGHLALARGQWSDGFAQFDSVGRFLPAWRLELESFFSAMTFSPASEEDLRGRRETLRRWNPDTVRAADASPPIGYENIHGVLKPFLLGMLSVRLGDWTAAESYAREVERVKDPVGAAQRTALGAEIRMYAALRRGERPRLEASGPEWPAARNYYRYLRGWSAVSEDRGSANVRLLESFDHVDIESLPFAAPARALLAEKP